MSIQVHSLIFFYPPKTAKQKLKLVLPISAVLTMGPNSKQKYSLQTVMLFLEQGVIVVAKKETRSEHWHLFENH